MGTDRQIDTLAQAILQQLGYIAEHTSRTSEMLGTGVMNNVLEVKTAIINASGYVQLQWQATCGCIEIANHGATPVYVGSGPPTSQTPSLPKVDAGATRVINVGSRVVTIYGTAAAEVGYQAFTVGSIPRTTYLAVDGGTP